MKTYSAKPGEVQRRWWVVDAEARTSAGSPRVSQWCCGKTSPPTLRMDTGFCGCR